MVTEDLHAGEQIVEIRRDQILERQELQAVRRRAGARAFVAGEAVVQIGQGDETRQAFRNLDPRKAPLARVGIERFDGQG